jgi:hypothetical protein
MMLPEIRDYLTEVRSHLHLDPSTEWWIIRDLHGYFEEKIGDLRNAGLSEREAARVAIDSCGRPRVMARRMYEAHSKGSWSEAAIACLPHLIIAGLFLSHLWRHPIVAPIVLGAIVYITLYGWWHGKPSWLYPWAGYSLLPLLIGGYVSWPTIRQAASSPLGGDGPFPNIGVLLVISALFVSSIWVIARTTIRVVRRDWILASMMLVPLPIFGGWLISLEQYGGLFSTDFEALYLWDVPMALALVTLAVTSATFVRLRQRVLKVGALISIGSIALAMVAHDHLGDQGFWSLLSTSFILLLFLLSPALLKAKPGHGEQGTEAWWESGWLEQPPTAI